MKDKGKNDGKGLQIFQNPEFGEVRTTVIDGEPWFVAADICRALDIGNSRQAMTRLDDDEKNTVILSDGIPGNPEKTVVNEPGLYSLVLGSRKPEAKAFKRWITHDVIPAIRKHGGYMTPEKVEEALLNPDVLIKLATELKEERNKNKALHYLAVEQDKHIARQDAMIATLEPKGIFADSVSASDTTILIGELAKIIKQNGTDIGAEPPVPVDARPEVPDWPQRHRLQHADPEIHEARPVHHQGNDHQPLRRPRLHQQDAQGHGKRSGLLHQQIPEWQ